MDNRQPVSKHKQLAVGKEKKDKRKKEKDKSIRGKSSGN
jgi:hypothetical protein